jgi:hypothetical protein
VTIRQTLTKKPLVTFFLIAQLVPIVLFPAGSFSGASQEWWLPVLLAIMVIIADVELFFQRKDVKWPWLLIAFAQGFNIISRLLMMMPHATINVGGLSIINTTYLVLTILSMAFSAFLLWYVELPEVRMLMLRD